jgi:hypothetical protein
MSGFGDTGQRDRVHFARIFGERQDFGLLGRQDYVYVNSTVIPLGGDDDPAYTHRILVWKNVGSGGTKIKGL